MQPILKWLSCVVLCLTLVGLGAVLFLVWTMPDLPSTVHYNQICLPSEFGSVGCGKTTEILHDFLYKAVTKEYDTFKQTEERRQQANFDKNKIQLMAIYDKYFWEMKPAAKLTGKHLPKPRKEDNEVEMPPIRIWRNGRELSDTSGFLRYGVQYRNGRLIVPFSGTYLLYSYVDLFEETDPSTGKPKIHDASKPIKHAIYKFNILDEEEIELVSNVQPHTIPHNRYYNSYSSYVSTLAELKAGDEISVHVSNLTFLHYTKDNYFGLNLV